MPVDAEQLKEQLHLQVQQRLIETGEWDRLRSNFKAKLDESGWTDDFRDKSKEKARDMDELSFEDLLNGLTAVAHTTIPLVVRRDVMAAIQKSLEKQFE